MPTLVGARRRGYTPEGLRLFAERIGVSKADSWIDYSVLEDCMREHLNEVAPRRIAVLDPVRLIVENYPRAATKNALRPTTRRSRNGASAAFRSHANCGSSARTSWKSLQGLFPPLSGNRVRLRYGFVVECTGCDKDSGAMWSQCDAGIFPTRSRAPRGRRLQGEGQYPLGERTTRLSCGSTHLRPALQGSHPAPATAIISGTSIPMRSG